MRSRSAGTPANNGTLLYIRTAGIVSYTRLYRLRSAGSDTSISLDFPAIVDRVLSTSWITAHLCHLAHLCFLIASLYCVRN